MTFIQSRQIIITFDKFFKKISTDDFFSLIVIKYKYIYCACHSQIKKRDIYIYIYISVQ